METRKGGRGENMEKEKTAETASELQNRQMLKESDLCKFSTKSLVEELSMREAVEKYIAEPYKDLSVTINGPAIVLVITD